MLGPVGPIRDHGSMQQLLIGVVFVVAAVAGVVWLRLTRGDEVFDGLTPGLVPAAGQAAVRRRIRNSQRPPVAVRFNPPDGLNPGLVGVAIDGRVDPVELSATLIDLAGRGWLTMHPVVDSASGKPTDWELRQSGPVDEALSATETVLLGALFAAGPTTTLSEFRQDQASLNAARTALHGEAEDRRWFLPPDSASRILRWVGWALIAAAVIGFFSSFAVAGAGLGLAGIIAVIGSGQRDATLSAEGSAARAQAESFKLYLATAEADQLRFEVGIDVFSRYLPYAMVLGVVDHWRSVFADAVDAGMTSNTDALGWLVLDDALTTVLLLDLLSDSGGVFDSLVGDFSTFDVPALDGLAEGVSDFGSSISDGFGDFGGFGD